MNPRPYTPPASVTGFSAYFDAPALTEDVLAGLGYRYVNGYPALPRFQGDVSFTRELTERLREVIPQITLTSEIARREFLIAPLLAEIARRFKFRVNVEYAIEVSPSLRGSLDYLLASPVGELVIIEAKLADMSRGFKQLAAELVALDQWENSDATHLYGAVSVGDVWRFGVLDRATKTLTEDVEQFLVPRDLEDLTRVLVGALLPGDTAASEG